VSDPKKPLLEAVPNPEVVPGPKRRTFTAQYKLRILRELDSCSASGQIGEVLRREGLYSSTITRWRKKRAAGELQALSPKKQGRPTRARPDPEKSRMARENARLREELRKARIIIEVQKKVSEMLEIPPVPLPEESG